MSRVCARRRRYLTLPKLAAQETREQRAGKRLRGNAASDVSDVAESQDAAEGSGDLMDYLDDDTDDEEEQAPVIKVSPLRGGGGAPGCPSAHRPVGARRERESARARARLRVR